MARFNVVPAEASYATNAMLAGEPYGGVRYTSLQLSGRTLAKPVDKYAEGLVMAQLATTYWPGGVDGVPEEALVTVDYIGEGDGEKPDPAVDTARALSHALHRQIFGMDLANTTLLAGRYKADYSARWAMDYGALETSRSQSVPLGAIAISRVVAHNQLRPGTYVAELYFPQGTVYPLSVLRAIKAAMPVRPAA